VITTVVNCESSPEARDAWNAVHAGGTSKVASDTARMGTESRYLDSCAFWFDEKLDCICY